MNLSAGLMVTALKKCRNVILNMTALTNQMKHPVLWKFAALRKEACVNGINQSQYICFKIQTHSGGGLGTGSAFIMGKKTTGHQWIIHKIPLMAGTCMLTVLMGNLVTRLTFSLLSFHSRDQNVPWCSGHI
uniref:Alternative protein C10orf112 n=1 Tax=Homo sapiens TaxID=9606 RepID=L8ECQ7_HUMAN|nr:alternative protein C10orf112 [Homo sapiens]